MVVAQYWSLGFKLWRPVLTTTNAFSQGKVNKNVMHRKRKKISKSVQYMAGGMILILGVALILTWWQDVEILFKGSIGIVIALSGLILLSMANNK